MKLFQCQQCAQLLYFENRQCQSCLHRLGYLPGPSLLTAVRRVGSEWRALAAPNGRYKFCANASYDACNWLVEADSRDDFCAACRHNRTIPDLTQGDNLTRWRKFELAKHRLFYTLIRLGLPLTTRAQDPQRGLVFDFLAEASPVGTPTATTGHQDGVIAVNLAEADDAERERLRLAMGETYRTLLGHVRHESGHYFWERLVRDGGQVERFRAFFGDERADYASALHRHYAYGPSGNWQETHISAYATAHPWEDFAETWAHYLHIVDSLEMAFAFDIRVRPRSNGKPSAAEAVAFDPHQAGSVDRLVEAWLPLTMAVNSIVRCMGAPDFYPFVLSPQVVVKLGFVHELIHGGEPIHGDGA